MSNSFQIIYNNQQSKTNNKTKVQIIAQILKLFKLNN